MLYSDLPEAEIIGSATNSYDLERVLDRATGNPEQRFILMDVATDGPSSCRVFFFKKISLCSTSIFLPRPMNSWDSAKEFFGTTMMAQSRWVPRESPSPHQVKGWQVRVATVDGEKVVIVQAVWI